MTDFCLFDHAKKGNIAHLSKHSSVAPKPPGGFLTFYWLL